VITTTSLQGGQAYIQLPWKLGATPIPLVLVYQCPSSRFPSRMSGQKPTFLQSCEHRIRRPNHRPSPRLRMGSKMEKDHTCRMGVLILESLFLISGIHLRQSRPYRNHPPNFNLILEDHHPARSHRHLHLDGTSPVYSYREYGHIPVDLLSNRQAGVSGI
jgi:hypothetical protein